MHASAAFNALRPKQNDHKFTGNIFKWFLLNENVRIAIKNLLNTVS